VVVRVIDHMVGMSAARRARLFQPLLRTTLRAFGAGRRAQPLGLPLAKTE